MSNLTPTIKSIQDVMRQDSGIDGDGDRCLGRSNNKYAARSLNA